MTDGRVIELSGTPVLLVLWSERAAAGELTPFYAISSDGDKVTVVRKTSYDLKLKYATFDPATESVWVVSRVSAD